MRLLPHMPELATLRTDRLVLVLTDTALVREQKQHPISPPVVGQWEVLHKDHYDYVEMNMEETSHYL